MTSELPDDLAAIIDARVKAEVQRQLAEREPQPPTKKPAQLKEILQDCPGCGTKHLVNQDPQHQNDWSGTTTQNDYCKTCKVAQWTFLRDDYLRKATSCDNEAGRLAAYYANDPEAARLRSSAVSLRNSAKKLDQDIEELK